MSLYDFMVTDQSTAESAVYFTVPVEVNRSWHQVLRRVPFELCKTFDTVEDLVNDRTVIPDNVKWYSVNELQQHIAIDSKLGKGEVYPELELIVNNKGGYNSPIAKVTISGEVKYIPNPLIKNIVKRIK
jgi:hypothetical protein